MQLVSGSTMTSDAALLLWAPLVVVLLHAVQAPTAAAAAEPATPRPVAGSSHAVSGRRVSYWMAGLQDPPSATDAMARIEAAGGSAVASNFFLYCGDAVLANGTFAAGTHADGGCDAFVAAARAKVSRVCARHSCDVALHVSDKNTSLWFIRTICFSSRPVVCVGAVGDANSFW